MAPTLQVSHQVAISLPSPIVIAIVPLSRRPLHHHHHCPTQSRCQITFSHDIAVSQPLLIAAASPLPIATITSSPIATAAIHRDCNAVHCNCIVAHCNHATIPLSITPPPLIAIMPPSLPSPIAAAAVWAIAIMIAPSSRH